MQNKRNTSHDMAKTQTDKMQALSVHRQGRSLKKGFSTEGKT